MHFLLTLLTHEFQDAVVHAESNSEISWGSFPVLSDTLSNADRESWQFFLTLGGGSVFIALGELCTWVLKSASVAYLSEASALK